MVRDNKFNKSSSPVFRSAKIEGNQPDLIGSSNDGEVAAGPGRPITIPPANKITILAPRGWNEPRLTTLGLYYPLGPCQIRMKTDLLSAVLQTLPDVFRKLSLHAMYKDSPITVVCRSLEQVELEVCIFGSRTNPGEIIVEIERKDGDVISYHQYANQVASALSGATLDSEQTNLRSPSSWDRNVLALIDGISEPKREDILEALETTWTMMSTDRYDAKRLGLESLVHMTDPCKSGFSVAKVTVECLLYPKDYVQERVSGGIFEYATRASSGTDFHGTTATGPFLGGFTEDDFSYLALIIVTQTFQVAAEATTIEVESFLNRSSFDLIECFLAKIHAVHEHPHQAYYAVQSLTALCRCVPSLRSRINNHDVEEAQLVGNSCHLALATATNNLLLSLQA